MKMFWNRRDRASEAALQVRELGSEGVKEQNAEKLAGKVLNDAMPGYAELFVESTITPAKIQSALSNYRSAGKLQMLSNIMDLLLDSDDNLQSKMDVRKEALKRASWSYGTELPTAKAEWYDDLLTRKLPGWIDIFIEGKLYGYHFNQIMWELVDGMYEPGELLNYKNLDLRISGRDLVLYDNKGPIALPEQKFIKILYRRPKLHAILKYYVFYAYAINHWAQFVETYGKPPRLGKYDPMATPKEVEVLKAATKALGTDQAAIISKNTEIEFKDFSGKNSSNALYESLCEFVTTRVTMAILGQTLTTQQGDTGSYAQAKIHNMVRSDIISADLADLRGFVNVILDYADAINWGGSGVNVWFEMQAPVDLVERISIDEKVCRLGVPIAQDWFYDTYGIERPKEGQTVVEVPGAAAPVANTEGQRNFFTTEEQREQRGETEEGGKVERCKGETAGPGQGEGAVIVGHLVPNAASVGRGVDKSLAKAQDAIRKCGSIEELKGLERAELVSAIGDEMAGKLAEAYADGRRKQRKNSEEVRKRGSEEELLACGMPEVRFEFDEAGIEAVNAFRNQAYIIAGVRVGEAYSALWKQAERILEEGGDFGDFIQSAKLEGFEPDNPRHLKTEYDTAIAGAQMAGRWQQIEADKDILPYLKYTTMGDELVREEHRVLDGTVAAIGDPFWDANYPPNGYNCRCMVEQLTDAEAHEDPKWNHSTPELGQAKEFKGNTGKDLQLLSDAWEKIVDHAIAGLVRNTERQSEGVRKRGSDKVTGNKGQVVDASNYPVIVGKVELPAAVKLEELKRAIAKADAIWHTDLNVTQYLKRRDGDVLVVKATKGRVVSAELVGSETAIRGYRER